MQSQHLLQLWDHVRQGNGIAMRLIAALPEDRLDSRPIRDMRTPKELVAHLYGEVIRGLAEGVTLGALDYDTTREREKKTAASLKTREDVLRFARDSWNAADKAVHSVTDAQLGGDVKSPFGRDLSGSIVFDILNEEFLHHRGQFYAFARAFGVEPPMLYDFANNEPAFQPKSAATTS